MIWDTVYCDDWTWLVHNGNNDWQSGVGIRIVSSCWKWLVIRENSGEWRLKLFAWWWVVRLVACWVVDNMCWKCWTVVQMTIIVNDGYWVNNRDHGLCRFMISSIWWFMFVCSNGAIILGHVRLWSKQGLRKRPRFCEVTSQRTYFRCNQTISWFHKKPSCPIARTLQNLQCLFCWKAGVVYVFADFCTLDMIYTVLASVIYMFD